MPTMTPIPTQQYLPWQESVTVTSVRTNSASVPEVVTTAGVYRRGIKEAAPSQGVYQSSDIVVTVATDSITFAPKPRDTVLWNTATYTALDVTGSAWIKFWAITARNLALHADLRGTCTISRPTNAQDTAGRPTLATYAAIATDLACRVQPEGGNAGDVLDRRTIAKRFTAFLGSDVDARAKDKLVSAGLTYTILEVHQPERITDLMSLVLERVL